MTDRKTRFFFFLAALALLFTGLMGACGRTDREETVTRPGNNRPRIISLAPSVTETLLELGVAREIVGVTRQDSNLEMLPWARIVGLYIRPNTEMIISLEPDMVFFDVYPGQEETRRLLAEMGITVESFSTRSIADIFEMVERLGEATGRREKAAGLADRMRLALETVSSPPEERERPRVYVEIGYNPIFTAGRDSYITEIIEAAGGRNIAAGIAGDYPRISPEFVIVGQPDAIVLPGMASDWLDEIGRRPGWEKIPAVAGNRIFSDADTHPVTIPSPRLITETLPALAAFLAEVR